MSTLAITVYSRWWYFAQIQGKDSCSGDSGGPLVVKTSEDDRTLFMYLEGIVSFGSETCNGGIPGLYTRVSTFIPWIIENLRPWDNLALLSA